MTDQELKELLSRAKTIAVVGLSAKPEKDSYRVADYLLSQGYDVIPVNPTVTNVLGRESKPSLSSIGHPVDIVDVFRRPEDAPQVVEDCLTSGNSTVWFQLGTITLETAAKAKESGLKLVTDRCIMVEHRRLFGR